MATTIDRLRLTRLLDREAQHFRDLHPRSHDLYRQARQHLLAGVPMNWMVRWAGQFPLFVRQGSGSHFVDEDGLRYIDFCLGDTGAMTGHAPQATVQAMIEQLQRGLTYMLPSEDAIWVANELARRFGLPYWQIATTATDANRFAIRLARHITRRPYVLVFNYCYHGTVDEAFITLQNGVAGPRRCNLGAPVNPTVTSKVVEFNDLGALATALESGDVACVLAEPVMTNIGIIHPDPGYHQALREITRRTGTLLILDETHTICVGAGGYTMAHGLEPDLLTIGKPIGGGMPVAAYGMSAEVAERVLQLTTIPEADTGGIGGTLAGNALALAAVRATLCQVLTPAFYDRATALATRFTDGVRSVIARYGMPWNVTQLGCRCEYWFRATPARNGGEAAAAMDDELERFMHIFCLNRGILMTPFHNMALIAFSTSEEDVDSHTTVFEAAVQELLG